MNDVNLIGSFSGKDIIQFINSYRPRTNISQGSVETYSWSLGRLDTGITLFIASFDGKTVKEYVTLGLIDDESLQDVLSKNIFTLCIVFPSDKSLHIVDVNNLPFSTKPLEIILPEIQITGRPQLLFKTKNCYGNQKTISNKKLKGFNAIDDDYWEPNLKEKSYIGSIAG